MKEDLFDFKGYVIKRESWKNYGVFSEGMLLSS